MLRIPSPKLALMMRDSLEITEVFLNGGIIKGTEEELSGVYVTTIQTPQNDCRIDLNFNFSATLPKSPNLP